MNILKNKKQSINITHKKLKKINRLNPKQKNKDKKK